jgi:hypothetical protein
MQTADWQTAFYFITAGIVLGLGLVWYLAMRQKDRSEDVASDAVGMKDLVARRDVLLEQLREMAEDSNEDDAGKRKLEVECATVLKEIDRRVRSSPQTASAKSATKARSTWIGFAWGVGVTVVAAFLIVTASRSGLRPATMGRADDVESLQRIVQQNPEDLDARLVLAKFYLMRHEMAAVMEQTQFVLARRPDDPRALSYEALVRYARGDPEKARAMLGGWVGWGKRNAWQPKLHGFIPSTRWNCKSWRGSSPPSGKEPGRLKTRLPGFPSRNPTSGDAWKSIRLFAIARFVKDGYSSWRGPKE